MRKLELVLVFKRIEKHFLSPNEVSLEIDSACFTLSDDYVVAIFLVVMSNVGPLRQVHDVGLWRIVCRMALHPEISRRHQHYSYIYKKRDELCCNTSLGSHKFMFLDIIVFESVVLGASESEIWWDTTDITVMMMVMCFVQFKAIDLIAKQKDAAWDK